MRTCSRGLPFLLFAELCLCAGCAAQRPAKPPQFADAYKALMVSYKKQVVVLAARPMPPVSMPMAQKRVVLAKQIDTLADTDADYDKRLEQLQAPASMQALKASTDTLFKVSADGNRRWAEAVRHSDSKAADQVDHQGEVNELAALKNMQRVLKQMGGTSPKLQANIDKMQKAVSK